MEAIAPDTVPPVQMVRHRVEVCALRNRGVKSGIEDCDLRRRLPEDLPQRPNSSQVVGIMERRQVDAVFNSLQDIIVDDDRFLEQLAAMHHAVSRRVDVSQAANLINPGAIRRQPAQHKIKRPRDITDGCGQLLPDTFAVLYGDDRFPADPLHLPTAQKLIVVLPDSLKVCGNHLELQTGASGVDDEDVHGFFRFCR